MVDLPLPEFTVICSQKVSLDLHNADGTVARVTLSHTLPKSRRKLPGLATEDAYLSLKAKGASEAETQVMLGLLEKALVKHLCEGDYSKLVTLSPIGIVRALHGPQIVGELFLHDTLASSSVWKTLKSALERDLLVYASTGCEQSV